MRVRRIAGPGDLRVGPKRRPKKPPRQGPKRFTLHGHEILVRPCAVVSGLFVSELTVGHVTYSSSARNELAAAYAVLRFVPDYRPPSREGRVVRLGERAYQSLGAAASAWAKGVAPDALLVAMQGEAKLSKATVRSLAVAHEKALWWSEPHVPEGADEQEWRLACVAALEKRFRGVDSQRRQRRRVVSSRREGNYQVDTHADGSESRWERDNHET